jgi:hypothetical protein
MRWAGNVARMGILGRAKISAYRILVWKPEGKIFLGRFRSK